MLDEAAPSGLGMWGLQPACMLMSVLWDAGYTARLTRRDARLDMFLSPLTISPVISLVSACECSCHF